MFCGFVRLLFDVWGLLVVGWLVGFGDLVLLVWCLFGLFVLTVCLRTFDCYI